MIAYMAFWFDAWGDPGEVEWYITFDRDKAVATAEDWVKDMEEYNPETVTNKVHVMKIDFGTQKATYEICDVADHMGVYA